MNARNLFFCMFWMPVSALLHRLKMTFIQKVEDDAHDYYNITISTR